MEGLLGTSPSTGNNANGRRKSQPSISLSDRSSQASLEVPKDTGKDKLRAKNDNKMDKKWKQPSTSSQSNADMTLSNPTAGSTVNSSAVVMQSDSKKQIRNPKSVPVIPRNPQQKQVSIFAHLPQYEHESASTLKTREISILQLYDWVYNMQIIA